VYGPERDTRGPDVTVTGGSTLDRSFVSTPPMKKSFGSSTSETHCFCKQKGLTPPPAGMRGTSGRDGLFQSNKTCYFAALLDSDQYNSAKIYSAVDLTNLAIESKGVAKWEQ
jgi:hypothetical protein